MTVGRNSDSAIRMRALRRAHSKDFRTAKAFAAFLGIPERNWNNYERGYPVGRQSEIRICQAIPAVTFDWIQRGRTGGLTVSMARLLEEAEAAERAEAEEKAKTGPR